MAQYTIEDIEILRKKSGITYEEAVNLLEYHNGSLARSLVDLEKNGKINPDKGHLYNSTKAKGIFNYLYRLRFKVVKKDLTVVNISALWMILTVLVAPHVVIIGLIAALLLGYRITGERNSREFATDSFDSMMKNAKENVQNTVNSFSKQFTEHEDAHKHAEPQEAPKPRTESAPSGTTPVNVQFPSGGSVDVHEDDDGYHEAEIK